jgi:hypothetical protein
VQLRNLLWATSKHDVYFMSSSTAGHWSSLSHNLSEVLDFSGHVAPAEVFFLPIPACRSNVHVYLIVSSLNFNSSLLVIFNMSVLSSLSFTQKHPGNLLEGFSGVQVSTLAVNEGLLVAGGFQGELVCKVRNQRRSGVTFDLQYLFSNFFSHSVCLGCSLTTQYYITTLRF